MCHAGDELEGLQRSIEFKVSQCVRGFFKHNFCVKPYVPREPRRDPSNRRVNKHGIYIRHCRNRTHNLIRYKREPIPLGHSAGLENDSVKSIVTVSDS